MLTTEDLAACIESRRWRFTRMVAALLGDAADAEDVVQDAALRALRWREGFRSEADVCSWFQRIFINSCREAVRKRTSQRNRLDAARREALGRAAGYAVDPETVAMALEDDERLKTALAALTPDQRLAVVLHDLEGWKTREIAGHAGLPLATVKSHLRRGRTALATVLAQALDGQADSGGDPATVGASALAPESGLAALTGMRT